MATSTRRRTTQRNNNTRMLRPFLMAAFCLLVGVRTASAFQQPLRSALAVRQREVPFGGLQPSAALTTTTSQAAASLSTTPSTVFHSNKLPASSRAATKLHSSIASTLGSLSLDRSVAVASVSATAKLLTSIGLGGLAAKKPGVLDPAAVSALSRLTYWVFQPTFLLCSVSRTLYRASSGSGGALTGPFLALMPLTACLQIGLGALVGSVVTRVMPLPSQSEKQNVLMCTAFGNSGPLPLIFADALFGGTSLLSEVSACVSFYLLVWSPLFWSFGKVILGTYGSDDSGKMENAIVTQIKRILSPPVIGSILGVIVGSIPALQRAFFGGVLTPLFGSLQTLGTAYLPAALLVLAGSLVGGGGAKKDDEAADDDDTINGGGSELSAAPSVRSLAAIFLSRFLLAPLVSLGVLTGLTQLGWLGPAGTRARSVVTFCILCEGCMPPAQNSVILLQLANLKARSKNMAQLLTLLYTLAVVPVTFLISACLAVSGIMNFR